MSDGLFLSKWAVLVEHTSCCLVKVWQCETRNIQVFIYKKINKIDSLSKVCLLHNEG